VDRACVAGVVFVGAAADGNAGGDRAGAGGIVGLQRKSEAST